MTKKKNERRFDIISTKKYIRNVTDTDVLTRRFSDEISNGVGFLFFFF